ncbi:GNAT family N-acetyltransferase [Flavobacteriaceae bacterium Ap0902]|nr:GNAT family N-acetyltransferase [Flavobacteriaceae bacterium Ap0902]
MEISNFYYQPEDFESFKNFILKTEKEFNPPISDRVNIDEYINKLTNEAVIILTKNKNHEIIGTACFYCNPKDFEYAFLSYIATTLNNQGIGSLLVNDMIAYCKKLGAKGIETQTWENNNNSLKLFNKFNFEIVGKKSNRSTETNSIILRLIF